MYAIVMNVGNSSLEVLQYIVSLYDEIDSVKLIAHEVGINWGQKYDTNNKITDHLEESLIQETPLRVVEYDRQDFLTMVLSDLHSDGHNVWSFTSKVTMKDGSHRHIPMINFHPLKDVTLDDIKWFIVLSEPLTSGVLLESGRYYHYYQVNLLSEEEWIQFNARFLMPMILVRSRYIGHRLRDGYSTLRLTNDTTYKPKIPRVIVLLKN